MYRAAPRLHVVDQRVIRRCRQRRRFSLSGDIRPARGIGGQPNMLDLQREQFEHDERFHREIVRLDLAARLKHMALHFCKYTGQFAAILDGPENAELRSRTIIDSFIISLCSANALNFNLAEHITPRLSGAATLHDIGFHLSHELYPKAHLNNSWLFTHHAIHAARMARACEKIDHLEGFPFREELQEAVLRLCQIGVIAAYTNNIDLFLAVRDRRAQIRDRNPFISAITG
jgi:hypothetical protein